MPLRRHRAGLGSCFWFTLNLPGAAPDDDLGVRPMADATRDWLDLTAVPGASR